MFVKDQKKTEKPAQAKSIEETMITGKTTDHPGGFTFTPEKEIRRTTSSQVKQIMENRIHINFNI